MNVEYIIEEITRLEENIITLQNPAQIENDATALIAVVGRHDDGSDEIIKRIQFIVSQALWLQNKNQPALEIALQIKEWAEITKHTVLLIKSHIHCGAIYRNLGAFQESLNAYMTALNLSNQSDSKDLLSNIMGGLGQLYRTMHEFDKALEAIHIALDIAQQKGIKKRIASWSGQLGLIYDDMGQYQQAILYYKKALEISEEENNIIHIALWSGNLGVSYQNISDYVQSLQFYQKALRINEELKNRSSIAINIGNIGNVYFCLGEYEMALEHYRRALALYEQEHHLQGIADCTGNIGNVYIQMQEYEEALEYLFRNIAINQQLNNKHGIANNTGNVGSVYMLMAEYEQALHQFNSALYLHREIGNKHGMALWQGAIGTIYAHKDFTGYNIDIAVEYLHKALSICEEEGMRKEEYEFHKSLAELYREAEQWQKFAEHYKLYRDIEHEVITTESRKQAAQMDYERKAAEREKQLAVERAETRARLEEQEKLILNILPQSIATRLLHKETFIVDHYNNVSIMFMDLVNFTGIAAAASPKQLIHLLNTIFSTADTIMKKYGLEKIKTIGDAYMAVAGAPIEQDDHALRAANAAIDLVESMGTFVLTMPEELGDISWTESITEIRVRIGLHCGEAIGGVIGDTKFTFDLWGDAVNTAARMESHGEAGKIHVSEEFVRELGMRNEELRMKDKELTGDNSQFIFIPRGVMEIKGKGMMKTFFLEKYL